jgi:hypothetical protein
MKPWKWKNLLSAFTNPYREGSWPLHLPTLQSGFVIQSAFTIKTPLDIEDFLSLEIPNVHGLISNGKA